MANRTYQLLARYSEGAKEHKGILSPVRGRKNRTVRFEFPSQVTNVRTISKDLDDIASSLAVLKKPTATTLMPTRRLRLVDNPISLVDYKSLPQLRLKPNILPQVTAKRPQKRMIHKAVG